MDQSVESAIEKIKMQEQDMEARLKEKREYEGALSSLNRAIKTTVCQSEKSDQEQLEIANRIKTLRPMLEIEKIKRNALSGHIKMFTMMLENLRGECDRGITKVWNIRSSLCQTVQNMSDECDIRALLMRPVLTDPLPQVAMKKYQDENVEIKEDTLQAATQRREKALAEREKLLSEPETGEEFVRIRNALHYSMEKIANLQVNSDSE